MCESDSSSLHTAANAYPQLLNAENGEGSSRRACQALRHRINPRVQEVQVQPIPKHILGSDRGGEHPGGGCLVLGEEVGLHLQGQD